MTETFFHDSPSIFDGVSHHVLEIGTVGYMHINKEFRHPSVVKLQPSTHFRSIGFQEVAVQVDELGSVTSTQFFRSVLVDAVGRTKVFVTVHIEYRNENKAHIIQEIDILLFHHHIADKHHAGILAIGFSRVNARLNEDNHTALGTNLGRVLQTILIYDDQRQVTPLGTGTKRRNLHHRRVIGQFLEPSHGFGKTRGFYEVRLLTISHKIFFNGLLSTRDAHQQTEHST